jgi:hypothetical protein
LFSPSTVAPPTGGRLIVETTMQRPSAICRAAARSAASRSGWPGESFVPRSNTTTSSSGRIRARSTGTPCVLERPISASIRTGTPASSRWR